VFKEKLKLQIADDIETTFVSVKQVDNKQNPINTMIIALEK
jgi:hypothetical protein